MNHQHVNACSTALVASTASSGLLGVAAAAVLTLMVAGCSSGEPPRPGSELADQAVSALSLNGGCAHDKCSVGGALDASCDSCVGEICYVDPYCCNSSWDSVCVEEVETICGKSCNGGGCAHDKCSTGGALDPSCDPCVDKICYSDPYCCNNSWDSLCVEEVETICGQYCY